MDGEQIGVVGHCPLDELRSVLTRTIVPAVDHILLVES